MKTLTVAVKHPNGIAKRGRPPKYRNHDEKEQSSDEELDDQNQKMQVNEEPIEETVKTMVEPQSSQEKQDGVRKKKNNRSEQLKFAREQRRQKLLKQ